MLLDEDRFEYDTATRKRHGAARDRLQFAPFGIVTAIAKEVGVRRQYAHSVIFDEDTFDKYRSAKARQIWQKLEERIETNKYVPVIEKVVKTLQGSGTEVKLKMSSRLFSFLKRRLARLSVMYHVDTDSEVPATYTFRPARAVAKKL